MNKTKQLTQEQEAQIHNIINKHMGWLKKSEDGTYSHTVYVDYDDKLCNTQVKKIFNAQNVEEAFYEALDNFAFDAISDEETSILDTLKKHWADCVEYKENEEFIREWVEANITLSFPYDHYLNEAYEFDIIVDTGDGNYDYTLNNLIGYYANNQNIIEKESAILWLVKQQGYTEEQLKDTLFKEQNKDNKFLKSIYEEIENTTTSMNALTFAVKMTLKEIFDFKTKPKNLLLNKATNCGLIDFWNGAGGLFDIQLEKPVEIPSQFIQIHLDGTRGYAIAEIYGMCSSAWKNTVLERKDEQK